MLASGSARRPRAGPGCRGAAPPASSPEASVRFERLWTAYPPSGRHNTNRPAATAQFGALGPPEQEAAIRDALAYAASLNQVRSQARRLDRWLGDGLRDGRWRNGELALGGSAAAATPVPNRVWIRVDTPEWQAHLRATTGKGSPERDGPGGRGWTFPSLMPPANEVA